MKKTFKIIAASLGAAVLPLIALAQSANQCLSSGQTLCSLINLVIFYLNKVLFLLMGVAIVIFVWYVIKYFVRPNENRAEAGTYVMYSVIGFFVILSFWGIVNVLQNTFGLQNRPASWNSLMDIFPGGSAGSYSPTPASSYYQNGHFYDSSGRLVK